MSRFVATLLIMLERST